MSRRRNGFTLVEVLVTITIIGLLTGLFLGVLSASQETAKESRTKAMIARLDTVIMSRWESYRTRRVSYALRDVNDPSQVNPSIAAYAASRFGFSWAGLNPNQIPVFEQQIFRLEILRFMQRSELPQRYDDFASDPAVYPNALPVILFAGQPANALAQNYLRAYNANKVDGIWTTPTIEHQGAECLYLIVTLGGMDEDVSPIDQFRGMDSGDIDRDGMKEFHDGWGNPISFIRWPTMFPSDIQPNLVPIEAAGSTAITTFCTDHHDPFDPSRSDMPAAAATQARGYRLSPLIISPGPDGRQSIMRGSAGNDPYFRPTATGELPAGMPLDLTTDPVSEDSWLDNIHSHQIGQSTR